MLARHVSDLIGPSSGAFHKLCLQIWYVVIRVLLDTSSRYEAVGRTFRLTQCNIPSWEDRGSLSGREVFGQNGTLRTVTFYKKANCWML